VILSMTDYHDWVVRPPLLVVVSGPSGVGKTSLCERLVTDLDDAVYSISATTRPSRPGEVDGEEYLFKTEQEFDDLKNAGQLLEHARVHDHQYGTPRKYVDARLADGKVVVLNIDVQGGLQVMDAHPDAVAIFLMPPRDEDLGRRIRGRGQDSEETIRVRMRNARGEIDHAADYGYIVMNDDFDTCLSTLKAIVTAERSLRRRCFRPTELPDTGR